MYFEFIDNIEANDTIKTLKLRKRTSFEPANEDRIPWENDGVVDGVAYAIASSHQFITNKVGTNRLLAILPKWATKFETPRVSIVRLHIGDGQENVLPWHVDYGRKSVLNWYTHTNGETTKYRDGDFVANDGDMYLMAADIEHCVLMTSGVREMVSFSYANTDLEKLLEARHAN